MSLFHGRSTPDEIRQRFDNDVERFSNLETGQSAAMDAPLALDLVTQAALAVNASPQRILDLGCGAGNFSLRLLQACESIEEVVLVDLSRPMLERAAERVQSWSASSGCPVQVTTLQGDLRSAPFDDRLYDVVLAGAVLHHLRTNAQWEQTFSRVARTLAPGGSFWIFDLITHQHPAIEQLMWARYGDYLTQLHGKEYRDKVFAYATHEDSPRSLAEQLQLLSASGFSEVEVLHANTCFAAFGGIRR